MGKIILFPLLLLAGCLVAGLYGALHNQISYTVSPDYFHALKFHQFGIPSSLQGRMGAALVGFLASWWMGLFIGVPVLIVGLILPGWKAYGSRCLVAFAVVAGTALVVGLAALIHARLTITEATLPWDSYPDGVVDRVAFARARCHAQLQLPRRVPWHPDGVGLSDCGAAASAQTPVVSEPRKGVTMDGRFLPETELTEPIIQPPGAGKVVGVLGAHTTFKVLSSQTGGAYAVLEQEIPAGRGPPLHVHRHETEMFYVLEGQFEVAVSGQKVAAPPGSLVVGPRDIPHTFRNVGPTPGKLLLTVIPGRFADFFLEVDNVPDGDREAIRALAARYDVEFLE